jgi:A/G-specific adenine glycosylase
MQHAKWTAPLLKWFAANQRPMPWRDDPTPYKVWISEIMLQQTQVSTVIPYFETFIKHFPDVQTLAEAPEQSVLKCWEGLGYYSRARRLQTAARQINGPLKGIFPSSADDWKQLPGVGDYTAAAIASISCGEPEPAIDGNVLRVFSRLNGIPDDITKPALRNRFRDALLPAIKRVNPSAFNQAMMELGALICRPRQPRCVECPISTYCQANRKGLTDVIPFKPKKTAIPHHHEIAVIIRNKTRDVLLYRRDDNDLLGGLWAFPLARQEGRQAYKRVAQTIINTWLETTSEALEMQTHGIIQHAFSHFSRTIHVFSYETRHGKLKTQSGSIHPCWVEPQKLHDMPLSKVDRTIANLIA